MTNRLILQIHLQVHFHRVSDFIASARLYSRENITQTCYTHASDSSQEYGFTKLSTDMFPSEFPKARHEFRTWKKKKRIEATVSARAQLFFARKERLWQCWKMPQSIRISRQVVFQTRSQIVCPPLHSNRDFVASRILVKIYT